MNFLLQHYRATDDECIPINVCRNCVAPDENHPSYCTPVTDYPKHYVSEYGKVSGEYNMVRHADVDAGRTVVAVDVWSLGLCMHVARKLDCNFLRWQVQFSNLFLWWIMVMPRRWQRFLKEDQLHVQSTLSYFMRTPVAFLLTRKKCLCYTVHSFVYTNIHL